MEIVDKKDISTTLTTGRLSDGSDREQITVTQFDVKVSDNFTTYQYIFDHDPTEQEIIEAFSAGLFQLVGEDLPAKVTYLEGLVADLTSIVLGV